MQKIVRNQAARWIALASVMCLSTVSVAAGPNVKGKITGQSKLMLEVYTEAAKPDARRWTWREPSPSVDAQLRTLSAVPSRDVCIAAFSTSAQERQELKLVVTGGRVSPTTSVVAPNAQVSFRNADPFVHRVFVTNGSGQRVLPPEDLATNAVRAWTASAPGRYEIRDELAPSVRSFIVVEPQLVTTVYPSASGQFALTLPAGEYVLKAFFGGRQVGKPVALVAKDRGVLDLKEPLRVDEGSDSK